MENYFSRPTRYGHKSIEKVKHSLTQISPDF